MIRKIIFIIFIFNIFSYSQNNSVFVSSNIVVSTDNIINTLNISSITIPKVNIVYPYENMKIPYVPKTFIFGNITPQTASLRINGENINVYKNGAFIAYLPVNKGNFKFEAQIFDGISTQTYTRNVYVAEKVKQEKNDSFYINLISPAENLWLMPGDYINIIAKANPGNKLIYEIEDIAEGDMEEIPKNSGFYYGLYRIKDTDKTNASNLILKLKKGMFSHDIKLISRSKIKIMQDYFIIKTSTNGVILKNDVNGGYTLFLSSGVKLTATGKFGSMYRVRVANQILWLQENNADYISDKMKETKTETGTIYLKKAGENKTSAKLSIYEKVPYSVEERENSFILTLYYTNIHTNWIIYDTQDNFIKNVNFKQLSDNAAEFTFNFNDNKIFWGYDIEYGENSLNINFKFKPEKNKNLKPLEGLKIIIDPGHSPKNTPPFDGAIGPMGSFEYDVNLKIAKKLYEKLLALGATVYMTRYGDENVPLVSRPIIARQLDGDIFISIHNNAIPDGEDPFSKPRGFQVYYYHNHSMPLAYFIHRAFLKNIPLPDEGLRYGDYHVIRSNTYMPSVLIENAYMIIPEQEEMLNDVQWQDKFAQTIKEGIINYLQEVK